MSTQTREQQTIEYITATSALIEKAAEAERARAVREKNAAEQIPQVVEAMITAGLVLPREREKLARVLADHGKTLEVLQKAAEQRSEPDGLALGRPQPASGPEKRAYHSTTSPYTGLRTSQPKESDLAFLAKLGLAAN
jgi:hypothetical protein